MADEEDAETTSLEMLRDYECPEGCELFGSDDGTPFLTEREASDILGGDENGFLRCPECGEELVQTDEAALDMLALVAERFPELAPRIAQQLEGLV